MPQLKTAKKALRQAKKRTIKNLRVKKNLKRVLKETNKAIQDKSGDLQAALKKSQKTLNKAAKMGIIKKNTASRKLSRLAAAAKKALKK